MRQNNFVLEYASESNVSGYAKITFYQRQVYVSGSANITLYWNLHLNLMLVDVLKSES